MRALTYYRLWRSWSCVRMRICVYCTEWRRHRVETTDVTHISVQNDWRFDPWEKLLSTSQRVIQYTLWFPGQRKRSQRWPNFSFRVWIKYNDWEIYSGKIEQESNLNGEAWEGLNDDPRDHWGVIMSRAHTISFVKWTLTCLNGLAVRFLNIQRIVG